MPKKQQHESTKTQFFNIRHIALPFFTTFTNVLAENSGLSIFGDLVKTEAFLRSAMTPSALSKNISERRTLRHLNFLKLKSLKQK